VFRSLQVGPDTVLFRRASIEVEEDYFPTRITYARRSDGGLNVVLEGIAVAENQKTGKAKVSPHTELWAFQKVG
jgi:hypothetical protein